MSSRTPEPNADHLEPRVTRMETEVRQVRQDISDLARMVDQSGQRTITAIERIEEKNAVTITALNEKIAEDRQKYAERGRVSWSFVLSLLLGGVSMMGAVGTVIGLYISLTISPIRGDISSHTTGLQSAKADIRAAESLSRDTLAEMRQYHAANDANMREIETQFGWQDDITDLRFQEFDRMLRLLWKKQYQEDLPPSGQLDHGPADRRHRK